MATILNENIPTIPDFFRHKNVFMTGGSGFIGKVLIEKLLRSCPDIGNIYVLLREKRGKSSQERINNITNIPLFDLLKKQDCDAIKKIVPVNGDVCKLRLGLSDENRDIIINEVNIVFHIAASVRFNDPLKKAILYNVRSTIEIIRLVKDLKNLAVFAHVSTAYCNADKKVIEEILYPPHADWREAIRLVEEVDEDVLEIFAQKYIEPLSNTYLFTKSLAEHVVNDLCSGQIPAVIFRPTIVIPSLKEPVPGWVDNFNGPLALCVAGGVGFIRISYLNGEKYSDYVFVDGVAKSLIIATWEKAVKRDNTSEMSIYNCSNDIYTSNDIYLNIAVSVVKEFPFERRVWTPTKHGQWTRCYYYYLINVILFHITPAILLDGLLKLFGKKPLLLKFQRRVFIANTSLFYFLNHSWEFKHENYLGLEDKLLKDDVEAFSFRCSTNFSTYEEKYDIIKKGLLGSKKYLLNESAVISKRTIIIDKCFRILDQTLKIIAYGFILYTLFWKHDIISYLSDGVYCYFSKL